MVRYLKNMEKEIIIANNVAEIDRITEFIEELGTSLQLSPEIMMNINLAVEEAISNIIRHSYPDGKNSEITLKVKVVPEQIIFEVIDDGISFDPSIIKSTSEEDKSVLATLERCLAEGLELFIVRRTMDKVEYHTLNSLNHLILTKHVNTNLEPKATMKTNCCKIEGVTILAIEGRLDTANAHEFESIIQPIIEDEKPDIIINCEGLSYISSSGLRGFILLQKSVTRHAGSLVIEAMRPEIKKIFDMTGCSSLFTIR